MVRDTICSMLGPEVAATLGLPPSEDAVAEQPAAAGASSGEAAAEVGVGAWCDWASAHIPAAAATAAAFGHVT
jgi:hypothetical protein